MNKRYSICSVWYNFLSVCDQKLCEMSAASNSNNRGDEASQADAGNDGTGGICGENEMEAWFWYVYILIYTFVKRITSKVWWILAIPSNGVIENNFDRSKTIFCNQIEDNSCSYTYQNTSIHNMFIFSWSHIQHI